MVMVSRAGQWGRLVLLGGLCAVFGLVVFDVGDVSGAVVGEAGKLGAEIKQAGEQLGEAREVLLQRGDYYELLGDFMRVAGVGDASVMAGGGQGCKGGEFYVGQWAGMLVRAEGAIAKADKAVGDMLGRLDRYDGGDWQVRFGDTGVYDKLVGMRQEVEFLRTVAVYYKCRLGELGTRSAAVKALRQAEARLGELLAAVSGSGGGSGAPGEMVVAGKYRRQVMLVALWRLKMGRLLVLMQRQGPEQGKGQAGKLAEELKKLSARAGRLARVKGAGWNIRYELAVERLICMAESMAVAGVRSGDAEKLEAGIKELGKLRRQSLTGGNDVGVVFGEQLKWALLRGYLEELVVAGRFGVSGAADTVYMSGRGYLKWLWEVQRQGQVREGKVRRGQVGNSDDYISKWRDLVSVVAGGRLAVGFEALCGKLGVVQAGQLLQRWQWDGRELITLARYYTQRQSWDFDKARQLYGLLLAKGKQGAGSYYAAGLYEAGWLCVKQSERGKNLVGVSGDVLADKVGQSGKVGQVVKGDDRLLQRAGQWWYLLARDCSGWAGQVCLGGVWRQVSAKQVAVQCAGLGYVLFGRDRGKYGKWAAKMMAVLVGKMSYGGKVRSGGYLKGTYSDCAAAKRYRYYYGVVLKGCGEWQRAAEVFDLVGSDDLNKGRAEYESVLCRYMLLCGQAGSGGRVKRVSDKPYKGLIAELKGIVATQEQREVQQKRKKRAGLLYKERLLLGQLYEKVGETNKAWDVLSDIVGGNSGSGGNGYRAGSEQVLKLALLLGEDERDDLLQLHALGDSGRLGKALGVSLAVLREVYDSRRARGTLQQDRQPLQQGKGKFQSGGVDGDSLLLLREYLERLALFVCDVKARGGNGGSNRQWARYAERAKVLLADAGKLKSLQGELWLVRCRAMVATGRGDWKLAGELWYRIWQGIGEPDVGVSRKDANKQVKPVDDAKKEMMQYYWWEGRYYGMICLCDMGRDRGELAHAIDVLLKSRVDYKGQWRARLLAFRKKLYLTGMRIPGRANRDCLLQHWLCDIQTGILNRDGYNNRQEVFPL